MKRFNSLLLCLALFLSLLPLSARAESLCDVDELGLTLSVPTGCLVFDRNVSNVDPGLAILGYTQHEMLEKLENRNAYLLGYPTTAPSYFEIEWCDGEGDNFNEFSDQEFCDLIRDGYDYDDGEWTTLSHPELYPHPQRNFVKYSYRSDNETTFLEYFVPRGYGYLRVLTICNGSSVTPEEEQFMDNIIDSISFYIDAEDFTEPLPTDPTDFSFQGNSYLTYFDSPGHAAFAVPSRWEKAERPVDSTWVQVRYRHKEDPEAFFQYGSVDILENIQKMKDDIPKTAAARFSLAFLRDEFLPQIEGIGPVTTVNFGDSNMTFCRFTAEQENTSESAVPSTFLAYLKYGRLYLFQFSGDDTSPYYEDISHALSGVQIFLTLSEALGLDTSQENQEFNSTPSEEPESPETEPSIPKTPDFPIPLRFLWIIPAAFVGIALIVLVILLAVRQRKKKIPQQMPAGAPPFAAAPSPIPQQVPAPVSQPVSQQTSAPIPQQTPAGYYFENTSEFLAYQKLFGETATWLSGSSYIDEVNRGSRLFEQGQVQEAVQALQNALQMNPVGLSARFELCEIMIRLRDFAAAKQTLFGMKEYLTEPESIAKFYRRFGYIKAEEGQLKQAIACYRYSEGFAPHPSVQQELAYLSAQPGYLAEWTRLPPEPILAESEIPLLKKPEA